MIVLKVDLYILLKEESYKVFQNYLEIILKILHQDLKEHSNRILHQLVINPGVKHLSARMSVAARVTASIAAHSPHERVSLTILLISERWTDDVLSQP